MVLAPEHELVDGLVPAAWPAGTQDAWTGGHATPARGGRRVPRVRPAPRPTWSGRPTPRRRPASSSARTPPTRSTARQIPIFIADYVLAGYGTGAIMAVPGQDERDWEFAEVFDLPIVRTVQPSAGLRRQGVHRRRPGDQLSAATADLDGLGVAEAKAKIIDWLEAQRARPGRGHLPAARLAVQPAALLGRAVPDRLRRDRPADRAARVDAAGRAARGGRLLAAHVRPRRRRLDAGDAAVARPGVGRGRAGPGRRAASATPARPT